ncbi:MAG TPA: Calx-beta domain-containing protein [Candidatus Sulfotelmatobacter sp.]|nr:Calx-beta domain-containing protein [Candidatus Sulfotelmatobacter sp.]
MKIATFLFFICLAAVAAPPAVTFTQNASTLGRYDVYELTMTNPATYANPWEDPAITAVFTGPSGTTNTAGGFYFATNTWKLRFAPMVAGAWSWTLSYSDSNGVFNASGGFNCTNSGNIGFLRRNPANAYNFITDAQSNVFRVFGYQQGWSSALSATYPTDISQFNYPVDGNAQPTTLEQQLQNAQAAGFNMIRINTQEDAFDHLSPYGHFNINNTGKNEYDLNQGFICDELMAAIHRVNFKCLMSFWNAPANWVPGSGASITNAGAPTSQAALRYHQYIINRFGAYVDIWELCNESTLYQSYIDVIVPYVRTNDPYQHLITMNGNITPNNNLGQFDVWTFHSYYSSATLGLSENGTSGHGMPVFDEECGNAAPFGSYDPRRFRILAWTGFFKQTSLLFWGYGGGGLPYQTTFFPGGLSNESIGWQEQLETKILTDFVSGLDPAAETAGVTLSPVNVMQAFALSSPTDFGVYITHGLLSLNAIVTNATLTLTVPTNNMQGAWIDPATGGLLKTITVNAGTQTIPIPAFYTDVALRLRAGITQPSIQFSSSSYNVGANQGSVTLTVYRLGSSAGAVSVNYATSDGLALAARDYTPVTGTLTWPANDVSPRTIVVPLLYTNNTLQSDREFLVSLSNPAGGAILGSANTALVMLLNPVVNSAVFDSANYTVPKAATNAIFTLNRLGNGHGPLTVYFSTRGGTATAGTDYQAVNPENLPTSSLTPITWADGDLSPKTATVQILNSGSTSNKTFVVALDDGLAPRTVGSGIPPYSRAGVVILATNTVPSPSILALTGFTNEVTSGFADTAAVFSVPATNVSATFQVARTCGSSGPVSISYSTSIAGTAEAAFDYSSVSGTLSWADGDTTNKTFTVPFISRPFEAGNLTLWIELSNPTEGAISGMPYAALVTIVETNLNFITPPNLVLQQPNETIIAGQSATISVVVSGSQPLTYQWQKNGTNIFGATNAIYIISSAQASDAGTYTVVIGNSTGVTATTGALVVVNPFSITDIVSQTNDVVITWTVPFAGTNFVQAAPQLNGAFTNISAPILVGSGQTNYVDQGAATNFPARFYRILLTP